VLGIRKIIAPLGAGVASAIGALTAPMALPLVRSYMTLLDHADWMHVDRLYRDMRAEADAAFAGVPGAENLRYRSAVDMRFAGQYHELRVELPVPQPTKETVSNIVTAFRERYTEVYGRVPQGLAVEVLNWHFEAESTQIVFELAQERIEESEANEARKTEREVYFAGNQPGYRTVPVYDRYKLFPGASFSGPCVIEEREATVIVPPGCAIAVDGYRNLVITLGTEVSA
jgi:N-methylhydantoinase A